MLWAGIASHALSLRSKFLTLKNLHFFLSQFNDVTFRKFVRIIPDSLINLFCLHFIEPCHIAIQYDSLLPDSKNAFLYRAELYNIFHNKKFFQTTLSGRTNLYRQKQRDNFKLPFIKKIVKLFLFFILCRLFSLFYC